MAGFVVTVFWLVFIILAGIAAAVVAVHAIGKRALLLGMPDRQAAAMHRLLPIYPYDEVHLFVTRPPSDSPMAQTVSLSSLSQRLDELGCTHRINAPTDGPQAVVIVDFTSLPNHRCRHKASLLLMYAGQLFTRCGGHAAIAARRAHTDKWEYTQVLDPLRKHATQPSNSGARNAA